MRILKGSRVHSVVDDGTFVRLSKGNKELTAGEINMLYLGRLLMIANPESAKRLRRYRRPDDPETVPFIIRESKGRQ